MLNIYLDNELILTIKDLEQLDRVVVYTVPVEYSPDGLFVAHWAREQIEPLPACRGDKYSIVAELTMTLDVETSKLNAVGYSTGGITYAVI